MKTRTHLDRTLPELGEIFVFGSNEAGIHGAGAALIARTQFGAKIGHGFGKYGQSFAIPTKDRNIKTLPLKRVHTYVHRFIEFARTNPDIEFFITRIGCGLAGYADRDIAPMFAQALPNCSYPKQWMPFL